MASTWGSCLRSCWKSWEFRMNGLKTMAQIGATVPIMCGETALVQVLAPHSTKAQDLLKQHPRANHPLWPGYQAYARALPRKYGLPPTATHNVFRMASNIEPLPLHHSPNTSSISKSLKHFICHFFVKCNSPSACCCPFSNPTTITRPTGTMRYSTMQQNS
jgi:hypothetical protein